MAAISAIFETYSSVISHHRRREDCRTALQAAVNENWKKSHGKPRATWSRILKMGLE